PVEAPVGGLDQGPVRLFAVRAVEAVQNGQTATWCDFEDRADGRGPAPANDRGAIEVAVSALHQPALGGLPVGAIVLGAKAVKRGQRAARGDFEDGALEEDPARQRSPVEVPIGGLDQPSEGGVAVSATPTSGKAEYRCERAARGDFEYCPPAVGPVTAGCPVQVSIGGLDQSREGGCAGCGVEAEQGGESLRRYREHQRQESTEHATN